MDFWRLNRHFGDFILINTEQGADGNGKYIRKCTDYNIRCFHQEWILPPTKLQAKFEKQKRKFYKKVAKGKLTEEQQAAVDGVIPLAELPAAYNGELSDPVKDLWRKDCTDEQKAAFWKAWPQIVKDNPGVCLSATFHNTYGYLYPGYVSTIKPTLIMGDHSSATASVKGHFDYSVNPLSERLIALTNRLNENALYRLLVSPGLYGWITVFAAVWLMTKRGKRELLSAVPALFTLAGCMLSAVNGYFRYAMPLYVSAPMLIWLVAQSLRQEA